MTKFTVHQAYVIMFEHLVALWEQNRAQYTELPGLLGDMQLLGDGYPIDQAYWEMWLESFPGESPEVLDADAAFAAMLRFLRARPYAEIVQLADNIEASGNIFEN